MVSRARVEDVIPCATCREPLTNEVEHIPAPARPNSTPASAPVTPGEEPDVQMNDLREALPEQTVQQPAEVPEGQATPALTTRGRKRCQGECVDGRQCARPVDRNNPEGLYCVLHSDLQDPETANIIKNATLLNQVSTSVRTAAKRKMRYAKNLESSVVKIQKADSMRQSIPSVYEEALRKYQTVQTLARNLMPNHAAFRQPNQ